MTFNSLNDMSNFLVSARKYRPVNFKDVVGQETITTTLKNAISNACNPVDATCTTIPFAPEIDIAEAIIYEAPFTGSGFSDF